MSRRLFPWVIGLGVVLLVIAIGGPRLMRARVAAPERVAPLPTLVAPASESALSSAQPSGQTGARRAHGTAGIAEAAEAPLAAQFAARKLIRAGQMTLEVGHYDEAATKVAGIAEAHGGYVAESQASRGGNDRKQGSITVRVPAERFGAAFAALKRLGTVKAENVGTQDVTKAYADLETRLRVKRDAGERLREILRERTADLSDVLEAERELNRITEEIERMEGERRFYDQQVALSTITLALHEPQAAVEPGAFSPLTEAFRDSLRVLSSSVAAIVYAAAFLTPWATVALVGWWVLRTVRRRRAATREA